MNDIGVRRRHGLLIGIDRYPNLPSEFQLRGCVNDARLMGQLLQDRFGFASSDLVYLLDEQATRTGMVDALNALVARVAQDDIVIIHYSGHGSQRTSSRHDEPSGCDSTLVAHDSGRAPFANSDIIDDEIAAWLSALASITPYVTLIVDCCHSGTMSRDGFGDAVRQVAPDRRSLSDMDWKAGASPVVELRSRPPGGRMVATAPGWRSSPRSHVMIAACHDDELAYETSVPDVPTRRHGALTYFLTQELIAAPPGATYRDVFERVRRRVSERYVTQHPQVEGQQDREIFGIHSLPPPPYVAVEEVAEGKVLLGAGAAHGVTIGSQWQLRPDVSGPAGSDQPLATVAVIELGSVTSVAKLLEGDEQCIRPGLRAVESQHAFTRLQSEVEIDIRVEGHSEAVQALTQVLAGSPLIRVVGTRSGLVNASGGGHEEQDATSRSGGAVVADARVYLVGARESVVSGDPVPTLTRLPDPSWVVVDRTGLLAAPPLPIYEAAAVDVVRDNLEKRTRYRNLLALSNPDHASVLRGRIEFTLWRQDKAAGWQEAAPDASGTIRYFAGDPIAFEIHSHLDVAVFVSVLDFGLSGGISLLYPENRASQKLGEGVRLRCGFSDSDALEVSMPVAFSQKEGWETFKLFASTDPTDFSWLTQSGVRSTETAGTLLDQLFARAYAGPMGRHPTCLARVARAGSEFPPEDWTTIERSFMLAAG